MPSSRSAPPIEDRRFERLFHSSLIGILLADEEKIIDANQAFLAIVGHSREDLVAGRIRWRNMTPDEFTSLDDQAIRELRERGECTPYEKEYFRKDGSRVPILIGATALQTDPLEWACFILDRSYVRHAEAEQQRLVRELQSANDTLRLQAEELEAANEDLRSQADELREMTSAAEKANRLKDEFLAMVSHDLRTPLNSILGFTHLLASGRLDGDGATRALEIIDRSARAQLHLVDDLLDISRILSGKLKLDMRDVELAQVISSALQPLYAEADAKGITVTVDVRAVGGCAIHGDAHRLEQVIWNLVSNSIKFTPQGGRVEVSLSTYGPNARIVVRDTGKGISKDLLPHIFDRFSQGRATARAGLGLGLAIVRHVVEMHGGTVAAESPGERKGSIFTVTLPLQPRI